MKDTLNKRVRVLIGMIVSITLTLLCVSWILSIRDSNIFPSNLVVNNFALANIQKSEASVFLDKTYANEKLLLSMPEGLIELDLIDCGVSLNTIATLEKLEAPDFPIKNIMNRGTTKVVRPVFEWDEEILIKALEKFVDENSKPAINAQVIYQDADYKESIPHKIGYSINLNKTIEQVTKSLSNGELGPIEVQVEELIPVITLSDLQYLQDLIAVSNFKNLKTNAIDDQIVSALANTIILPNTTLSLEDIWTKYNIDVNNSSIIPTLTTLLGKVSSQINISYDPSKKTIHNNLPSPILVNIYVDKDVLWLSIIGNRNDTQKKISLISEEFSLPPPTIKRVDTKLSAGEQTVIRGKDTIVIRKYRVIEEQGKLIEKTLLDEKKYFGYDTIIYVGSGTINK